MLTITRMRTFLNHYAGGIVPQHHPHRGAFGGLGPEVAPVKGRCSLSVLPIALLSPDH